MKSTGDSGTERIELGHQVSVPEERAPVENTKMRNVSPSVQQIFS